MEDALIKTLIQNIDTTATIASGLRPTFLPMAKTLRRLCGSTSDAGFDFTFQISINSEIRNIHIETISDTSFFILSLSLYDDFIIQV